MGELLHLVQRGGLGALRSLLAVLNVTARPPMARIPTFYYSTRHYNYLGSCKGLPASAPGARSWPSRDDGDVTAD